MKKKNIVLQYVSIAVFVSAAVFLVVKFGGPRFFRLYVRMTVGDCKKIAIFCMAPDSELTNPGMDTKYTRRLLQYRLTNLKISLPRGFSVSQEEIKNKFDYKRTHRKSSCPAVYVVRKGPDFFMGLFPQLKACGLLHDQEFIRRVMYAKLEQIQNINDAFFVIMKGIFIPDLGGQDSIKMVKFSIGDKTGFVSYNLTASGNFFDCNAVNQKGIFLKIYIKDKDKTLDLDKFLAIISTVEID